jgi:hypothetical protein
MRYGQDWLRAAGVAAIVVLAVGWTSAAWAQSCAVCKTTSLLLPLSGVFFIPGNPVIPAGENVSLIGKVHVVTHVTAVVGGNFLTDIYLNMAGVKGVGQTTGNMYIGTGSNKVLNFAIPGDPIIPGDPLRAAFMLEPTNRGGSVPLPLTFRLVLGSDGTLLTSSTVMVGQGGCLGSC